MSYEFSLSCFFIDVIKKYHDHGSYRRKSLFGAYSFRVIEAYHNHCVWGWAQQQSEEHSKNKK